MAHIIVPHGASEGYDVNSTQQAYAPTKVSENTKVTTDYNAVKSVWMESNGGAIFILIIHEPHHHFYHQFWIVGYKLFQAFFVVKCQLALAMALSRHDIEFDKYKYHIGLGN